MSSGVDDRPAGETGGSRLPVTNSTPARCDDPDTRRPERLTACEGVTLRREMMDTTVDRGADAVRWDEARRRWREYVQETAATSLVFEGPEGQRGYSDRSHRWSPEYREEQYAKMKDMERGIEAFYADPWTGLLTFTASSDDVPNPVDHLRQLVEGRGAVIQALRRALDDRTWDYWWVLEPHKSGYLHLHLAVVVEGAISAEAFRPAVEAHLRQVPAAGREAHRIDPDDPDDDGAVEVRSGREIENLTAYLNSYLGGYETEALEMPEHEQAAAAVLWATGKRQTGASRRLRGFMKGLELPGEEGWEFVAILDADGEERPVDGEVPGGVDTFETGVSWGPPD
jgi:hypothetical protein